MNTQINIESTQPEFAFVAEIPTIPAACCSGKNKSCGSKRCKDTLQGVKEFHDACGIYTPETPHLSNVELNELRYDLLAEELDELKDGMLAQDPVAVLDALVDLQYVLDGAFLALGFANYKDSGFAEVQRSNMSKLGDDGKPILREDGKVLKGPKYSAPDLRMVLSID